MTQKQIDAMFKFETYVNQPYAIYRLTLSWSNGLQRHFTYKANNKALAAFNLLVEKMKTSHKDNDFTVILKGFNHNDFSGDVLDIYFNKTKDKVYG